MKSGLARFIEKTGADELIIAAQIYDHEARLRSYGIAAQVRDAMQSEQADSSSRTDVAKTNPADS